MDMLTAQRLAALLLAMELVSGCSTSATITLRNGTHTSGRIVRSDSETVFVEKDDALWSIERDDIEDVSHPGIGEMIGGGMALAAAAGLATAAVVEDGSGDDRGKLMAGPLYLGAVALGVPALIVTIDGAVAFSGSRSRFAPPETSAARSPREAAKGIRLGFEF
jgi:transcriptional antiterminator Rof (Rho-off)